VIRADTATGAVIVSTPQDVALVDARKGVGMFNKVSIPVCLETATLRGDLTVMEIIGLLLNMSYYTCTSCSTPHELFGSSANFSNAADELGLSVLGESWDRSGKDRGS